MTTASNVTADIGNHHPADDRTWITVLATTGWVVLTTATVLLATGVWAVPGSPGDDSIPATGSGCERPAGNLAVPRPRSSEPGSPPSAGPDRTGPAPQRSSHPVAPRPRVSPDDQAAQLARVPRQLSRWDT